MKPKGFNSTCVKNIPQQLPQPEMSTEFRNTKFLSPLEEHCYCKSMAQKNRKSTPGDVWSFILIFHMIR